MFLIFALSLPSLYTLSIFLYFSNSDSSFLSLAFPPIFLFIFMLYFFYSHESPSQSTSLLSLFFQSSPPLSFTFPLCSVVLSSIPAFTSPYPFTPTLHCSSLYFLSIPLTHSLILFCLSTTLSSCLDFLSLYTSIPFLSRFHLLSL